MLLPRGTLAGELMGTNWWACRCSGLCTAATAAAITGCWCTGLQCLPPAGAGEPLLLGVPGREACCGPAATLLAADLAGDATWRMALGVVLLLGLYGAGLLTDAPTGMSQAPCWLLPSSATAAGACMGRCTGTLLRSKAAASSSAACACCACPCSSSSAAASDMRLETGLELPPAAAALSTKLAAESPVSAMALPVEWKERLREPAAEPADDSCLPGPSPAGSPPPAAAA